MTNTNLGQVIKIIVHNQEHPRSGIINKEGGMAHPKGSLTPLQKDSWEEGRLTHHENVTYVISTRLILFEERGPCYR